MNITGSIGAVDAVNGAFKGARYGGKVYGSDGGFLDTSFDASRTWTGEKNIDN